jgi:hypothetical protein
VDRLESGVPGHEADTHAVVTLMPYLAVRRKAAGVDDEAEVERQPSRHLQFEASASHGEVTDLAREPRTAFDADPAMQANAAPAELAPLVWLGDLRHWNVSGRVNLMRASNATIGTPMHGHHG